MLFWVLSVSVIENLHEPLVWLIEAAGMEKVRRVPLVKQEEDVVAEAVRATLISESSAWISFAVNSFKTTSFRHKPTVTDESVVMVHWEMSCGSVAAVKLMGLPLVIPLAYFNAKPQDVASDDGACVTSPPPPHPAIKQVMPSMAAVQKGDLIKRSARCWHLAGFKRRQPTLTLAIVHAL